MFFLNIRTKSRQASLMQDIFQDWYLNAAASQVRVAKYVATDPVWEAQKERAKAALIESHATIFSAQDDALKSIDTRDVESVATARALLNRHRDAWQIAKDHAASCFGKSVVAEALRDLRYD